MRLVTWNIRQGGGSRRESVADAVLAHDPDVVVLIEFIPTTAAALGQRLRVAGLANQESFLFAGDFNTGARPLDGPLNNFGGVDRFRPLETAGFCDAWRNAHGDSVEHTLSPNDKAYRIDQAMASASLMNRITGCRYPHTERLAGASDHSILLLDIAATAAEN